MASLITESSIGYGWLEVLKYITDYGTLVSPRGNDTFELLNLTLCIEQGRKNIVLSSQRDLNYRFMIAEWLWIMSSSEDVGTLAKYNSKMAEYSDDGFILNGAYGPRLMPQMPYILEALSKKDTRQAVATIWTPNPSPSKDVPCTISLQWMIREDKLHTTVNMRSSDAWLGLPYDFFNFSQISNVIAGQLNIDVGSVTMNLASSHLYRSQFKKAEEVIKNYRGVGYLESPPIPDVNQLPYELFLNSSLLNHGIQGAHEPWISYSLALQHSKEKALEVLHAIAPK